MFNLIELDWLNLLSDTFKGKCKVLFVALQPQEM